MNKDFYNSGLGKMQMHFHTTIRNVGLYLSVSLALLGVSRYYRTGTERSRYKQMLFAVMALGSTTNAFLISKYLLNDHKSVLNQYKEPEIKNIKKWYIIPNILMYVCLSFMMFSSYLCINTLRKIITNKGFNDKKIIKK
jgi:amino acid permease